MNQDVIFDGFNGVSRLDLWVLCLKITATGITTTLLILLAVFTLSLRKHGQSERWAAYHFILASLFATLYIGGDTMVRISVAMGDAQEVLITYRLILSAIVLSVAAYINLSWALEPERTVFRGAILAVYGGTVAVAALVWVNHPALIIASDAITVKGSAVYADYGAGAPVFFALCLTLFAVVCLRLTRLAYRVGSAMAWRLTVLAVVVLFATGVHDALRELEIVSSPVGLLSLAYACFQVGAFGVLAMHYSRTLQDRQHQNRKLRRLTDAVTRDANSGLFTRGHLENSLNQLGTAARGGLLFIDLDRFKMINDRFGHSCGDELIRAVADRIRSNMRDGDIPCRWGGDEFVVYLPGTDFEMLQALTHRLQQTFRTIALANAADAEISVSMGFAELSDGDWHLTLERADQAMYHAKHAGRDRLVIAPQQMPADSTPAARRSALAARG
ncbi:GGDEF domain-containing protein [Salinisphaera aquimarina]|uniref:diguanylate cyclase n=1 Tax=Salinisphaera aquimarina TaxID=2094031 RepID=A0ABV7EPL2_9GAMM